MAKAEQKEENKETRLELIPRGIVTKVESMTPMFFGKPLQSKKGDLLDANKKPIQENDNQFESRVWKERAHVLPNGHLYIPATMFTAAVTAAAAVLNEKIGNGKGQQTWTKQFRCGLILNEGVELQETLETVKSTTIFCSVKGKRNDNGSKVNRTFPRIDHWSGTLHWIVISPQITLDIFHRMLTAAGLMIGVGSFRAENGCGYGRFSVLSCEAESIG